jgi:uncharacterized protein (DUF433 family)
MTAPTEVNIGTLIERRPGVNGGRPVLKGTGVSVHRIALLTQEGLSPADIISEYPHLDAARVHAAIAYYHANQDLIEREIKESVAAYERAEQGHASRVRPAE